MQFLLTGLLAAVAVAAPQPARHHHHNNRPTPTPTPTPRPTPQSTIPDYVQIVGYQLNGKGCPQDSTTVDVLNNNTVLSLTYPRFEASSGGQFTDATFSSEFCVARVQLKYPQGWRWTVADTTIDYSLHMGASCSAQLSQASYFAGGDKSLAFKKQQFFGTTSRDFAIKQFSGDSNSPWSSCANSNIGQPPEFLITTIASVNCQNQTEQGVFTVINEENDFSVRLGLQWQRC